MDQILSRASGNEEELWGRDEKEAGGGEGHLITLCWDFSFLNLMAAKERTENTTPSPTWVCSQVAQVKSALKLNSQH